MTNLENAARTIGDAIYAHIPGGDLETAPYRDGVEIVRLIAGTEGRGDGTRAMRAACEIADLLGVPLYLTPDGSYYADADRAEIRLRDFYARFWFVPYEGKRMSRTPLKTC